MRPVDPENEEKFLFGAGLLVLIAAGVFAGVVGASGSLPLVALAAAAISALFLLRSASALFWFVIVAGIVVTGVAQLYLPGSRYIRYIVPAASFALFLHGISYRLSRLQQGRDKSGLQGWAIVVLSLLLISAAINTTGAISTANGLRMYLQVAILPVAMVLLCLPDTTLKFTARLLLVIAFLQLPFVLHQYFVLVPFRERIDDGGLVPVDIVTGTFGGMLLGGGPNSVLSLFMIVVVGCLAGLWRQQQLSGLKLAIASMLLLSPILVNNSKVSLIYLPLMFAVVFFRDVVERPARFVKTSIAIAVVLVTVLISLTNSVQPDKVGSWQELLDTIVQQQLTPIEERQEDYSPLTRWTAITFWVQEHRNANAVQTLLGHGPGASRSRSSGLPVSDSLAQKRYGGMPIGFSAVSALLWDIGLVGLTAVVGLFLAAFGAAGRVIRRLRDVDPVLCGITQGLRGGIAMIVVSLAHKDHLIVNLPFQTLVFLILGAVAVLANRYREKSVGTV